MENNPMPQTNVPQNPSGMPPDTQNKSRRFAVIALLIAGVVIAGLLAILFLRKNPQPTTFTFAINDQEVAQEEFAGIYDHYKSQNSSDFDRDTTLNLITELYVNNYILRKEYEQSIGNISQIDSQVKALQTPSSLQKAPETLVRLNKENQYLRDALNSQIGVKQRSGSILTLSLREKVEDSQKNMLEALMKQKLNQYGRQLSTNDFDRVKEAFLNDTQIKNNLLLHANASTFNNMPESHPFLPGNEFLDQVFKTPQNTLSSIFNASNGNTVLYGIVYPVSPLPEGKYGDFREWLAGKKQEVTVMTDFSAIE